MFGFWLAVLHCWVLLPKLCGGRTRVLLWAPRAFTNQIQRQLREKRAAITVLCPPWEVLRLFFQSETWIHAHRFRAYYKVLETPTATPYTMSVLFHFGPLPLSVSV